ncbi:MAG: NAD(P)H-binding protein [Kibdelosporangium sp.]
MATVLVTGGTGTTGRLLAAALSGRAEVRIATRKPAEPGQVRFDWDEPATYAPAVAGVHRIYLIAPIGVADPVPVVRPFLAEAVRAGVRRVVLLSSSAVDESATGLGALPKLVRHMFPEWTVLRPSWFMQNFLTGHEVGAGIRADGEIVTATGSGRVAFVDAADIAAVAAVALLAAEPHNTAHVITGPEAVSYADAAAIITEITGMPVRHRPVTPAEFTSRLVTAGVPARFAAVLAHLDEDIRDGAEDRVTSTVSDVTGNPAGSLRDFIAAHRHTFS